MGYKLGSVYIRKVHFRDAGHDPPDRGEGGEPAAPGDVGHQAGGRQPGERHHQFGGAGSGGRIRARPPRSGPPRCGRAFQEIAREPAVSEALFEILETQRMLASGARLMLLPSGPHGRMLATLLAAEGTRPASSTPVTALSAMGSPEPTQRTGVPPVRNPSASLARARSRHPPSPACTGWRRGSAASRPGLPDGRTARPCAAVARPAATSVRAHSRPWDASARSMLAITRPLPVTGSRAPERTRLELPRVVAPKRHDDGKVVAGG